LLGRTDTEKFRDRYLAPMVEDGRLIRRYDIPAHPMQSYTTARA
jgi:hypothetical protein